ncbi:MAG: hypothetical protein KDA65_16540 [Planctomycetaceae bacterium]|nr:hypothetical protein [Planctomycetaceae bacterium]
MVIRTVNLIRYLIAVAIVIFCFSYLGEWLIVPFLGLIFGAVLVSSGPILMCLIVPEWKWTWGVILVLAMMISSTLHLRHEPTFVETAETFLFIAPVL